MTKQALIDLRDAVRGGKHPTRQEWSAVFPDRPEEDDDYPRSVMATSACLGWLDAAKALHEAVLPGWHWAIEDDEQAEVYMPPVRDEDGRFKAGPGATSNWIGDPARAWLLAILEALIEGGDDE